MSVLLPGFLQAPSDEVLAQDRVTEDIEHAHFAIFRSRLADAQARLFAQAAHQVGGRGFLLR